MPTIMTILSCMLIGQFNSDQQSAATTLEPVPQTTSADDSIPSADTLFPADQPENSNSENTTPKEIPPASTSPKTTTSAEDHNTSITEQPSSLRKLPPQLIAEGMTLPSGAAISGQPLTLVQAMSASNDRRQQLAITYAYWKTVEAVAKYRFCLDHANQLGQLQPRRGEETLLQSARSAATAMLREAELAAGTSQFELAALMQIPANASLPLPADRPHVGAYRTNFQDLFATRPAPDRARAIDRTLPIRRMAIDQRAMAIEAAHDALSAAIDSHQAGQGGMTSVVSCNSQLLRQQRAFIETVCHYNMDIAEYAMIVAAPGATPQILVGFMIKSSRESGLLPIGEIQDGVRPASMNEPASSSSSWNNNGQPAPAPRRAFGASTIPTTSSGTHWAPSATTIKNEPTLAPQRNSATLMENNEPTPAPQGHLTPIKMKNEPTLAPPRPESIPKADDETAPTATEQKKPSSIRYNSGDPFSRRAETVNKPVVKLADASDWQFVPQQQATPANSAEESTAPTAASSGASTALYPALVEAAPAVCAKQLTLALHWDRSLPDGTGRPMTLEESLSRQTVDRRATVESFWTARQCAAEYQAIVQEIEFFDNLTPVVLERRTKPEGPAEMLFLRAARLNAKANLREAYAALIEAQSDLASRTQTSTESLLPLPSTPPHAGQYLLNLEAQPRSMVETWPMRRLAAAIPAYNTSLQEHAASVVAADTDREKAVAKYIAGTLPVEDVIEGITHQTRQTFNFLETLTNYNRSIAEYALTVLPPNAQPTRIAAAMVVSRQ